MSPEQIAVALRSLEYPDSGVGAVDCPDEMHLGAYAEGKLPPEQRLPLENHLADCSRCLQVIGLLCRELDADPRDPVAPDLLARAEQRHPLNRPPPVRWYSRPFMAAAASAVLAVPVLLLLAGRGNPPTPGNTATPESTRRASPVSAVPKLLSPVAGAVVDRDSLSIRWTAVPGSRFYDVRIVSDEGSLVAEQRVFGTEWRVPPATDLRPHSQYFVNVDAYPSENIRLESGHVPFQVVE
jgi:hypothetical protein